MTNIKLLFCLLLITAISCKDDIMKNDEYRFYVGTYTQKEGHVDGKGEGIYKIYVDFTKDSFSITNTITELTNPSFLATDGTGKHIYAVNELGPNEKNWPGKISRIVMDTTGYGRKSQEGGTYGNAPCHITLNHAENMYAVTNYLGGILAYGNINEKKDIAMEISNIIFNGSSTNRERQEASHLHQSIFTKDDSKLLVADLGADVVRVLSVDKTTRKISETPLSTAAAEPGDGPRHMVLSADEKFLYVVNELSNTISLFGFNSSTGQLTFINKTSTLPSGFNGISHAAHITISPDGKTLYASNRGHNSIAVFGIGADGKLSAAGHTPTDGDAPRNFTITKDGKYLVVGNQNSDNIVFFKRADNGTLTKVKSVTVKTPVCIVESR
jgi:6-phosphogluconolactonase